LYKENTRDIDEETLLGKTPETIATKLSRSELLLTYQKNVLLIAPQCKNKICFWQCWQQKCSLVMK